MPSAIKHIEYVFSPLGLQNATSPPAETAKRKMHLQLETNALSLPQSPPSRHISPSHFSGDHSRHNVKYLEHLLESSLATVAVIQLSGSALADSVILTPRAYDTIKALYALAALDELEAASSNKPRENDIPTRPTFSRNGRIHMLIPVDYYVMLFSWAVLVTVSFLVIFSLHWIC